MANYVINGNDSANNIYGTYWTDHIYAYGGNDYVDGRSGDDIIYGMNGNDYLVGGWGGDALYGGNNDDVLVGNYGNDYLAGQAGHDWIYGNNDADVIMPGTGVDFMYGGSQGDSFYFYAADTGDKNSNQADTIYDFSGEDQIYLKGRYSYAGSTSAPGEGQYSIWHDGKSHVVTYNSPYDVGFHDILVHGERPDGDISFF